MHDASCFLNIIQWLHNSIVCMRSPLHTRFQTLTYVDQKACWPNMTDLTTAADFPLTPFSTDIEGSSCSTGSTACAADKKAAAGQQNGGQQGPSQGGNTQQPKPGNRRLLSSPTKPPASSFTVAAATQYSGRGRGLAPPKCGGGMPYACPDGSCATDSSTCPMGSTTSDGTTTGSTTGSSKCGGMMPYECPDGTCETEASMCTTGSTTSDGTTTGSTTGSSKCGGGMPYECPDGSCATGSSTCPTGSTTGSSKCGGGMPYECPDGSCATGSSTCPTGSTTANGCPTATPLMCPDGTCQMVCSGTAATTGKSDGTDSGDGDKDGGSTNVQVPGAVAVYCPSNFKCTAEFHSGQHWGDLRTDFRTQLCVNADIAENCNPATCCTKTFCSAFTCMGYVSWNKRIALPSSSTRLCKPDRYDDSSDQASTIGCEGVDCCTSKVACPHNYDGLPGRLMPRLCLPCEQVDHAYTYIRTNGLMQHPIRATTPP